MSTTPETSRAPMPAETTHWAYDFADEVATTADCVALGLIFKTGVDGQITLATHSDLHVDRIADFLKACLAVQAMGELHDDEEVEP